MLADAKGRIESLTAESTALETAADTELKEAFPQMDSGDATVELPPAPAEDDDEAPSPSPLQPSGERALHPLPPAGLREGHGREGGRGDVHGERRLRGGAGLIRSALTAPEPPNNPRTP